MQYRSLVVAVCLLSASVSDAAQGLAPTAEQVALERLRFDQSAQEFTMAVEMQKLEIEKQRAWITGISYMVPLMVAAISFLLGIKNQAEQSRLQRESQEKTSLAQFELKAAEIVLAERGPVGALNKARALKALFPHRLPEDFVAKFDPAEFQSITGEGGVEAKIKFFEVASKSVTDEEGLALLWRKLFPSDLWTERLAGALKPTHEA